jgi:Leucine-rich repeat (LRR) protein
MSSLVNDKSIIYAWRDSCLKLQNLWPLDIAVCKWYGLTFGDTGSLTENTLIEIHLVNLGLTSIPAALGGLKGLSYLNLRDNKLTRVPAELADIQWLTYLNLARNRLSCIPPALGTHLTRLKTLYLTDNCWRFKDSLPVEWRGDGSLRMSGTCDFKR